MDMLLLFHCIIIKKVPKHSQQINYSTEKNEKIDYNLSLNKLLYRCKKKHTKVRKEVMFQ